MILNLHDFMSSIAHETGLRLTINPDKSKNKNHYYFLEHKDKGINDIIRICVSHPVIVGHLNKDFILLEHSVFGEDTIAKFFDNRKLACEDQLRGTLLYIIHTIDE